MLAPSVVVTQQEARNV